MHDTRNRMALNTPARGTSSSTGGEIRFDPALRRLIGSGAIEPTEQTTAPGFMLGESRAPRFPDDVLIAPLSLPGAAIVSVPIPHEAIKPSRKKQTARKPKVAKSKPAARKQKPRKARARKSAAKDKSMARESAVSAGITAETASAASPVMPPVGAPIPRSCAEARTENFASSGLGAACSLARLQAATDCGPDHRTIAPLPRNRAITTPGQGMVARLVSWLGGLGTLLPRKRRRVALPSSRQVLPPQTARRRPVQPNGLDELSTLRSENERLRRELALLAGAALREDGMQILGM